MKGCRLEVESNANKRQTVGTLVSVLRGTTLLQESITPSQDRSMNQPSSVAGLT